MNYNVILENKSLDDLIDIIYPIGSVYISVTSTNPQVLFGGEWTQIKDTFLLACGDSYANGATGGEANHTLTVNEMPSHRHGSSSYQNGYPASITGSGDYITFVNHGTTSSNGGGSGDGVVKTTFVGGSQPHNNMPPYLAVYMWKRIS